MSERDDLRGAIADLAASPAPDGNGRLRQLARAYRAYRDARAAGHAGELDLSDDLPASPELLSVALGFAAGAIARNLTHEWTPATFQNAAVWRSGLQAMLDATGVEADVDDVDAALRAGGDEGSLPADEIPDVPPSHWWWWLPDDPPAA